MSASDSTELTQAMQDAGLLVDVVDALSTAVLVLDRQFTILYLNPAAETLLGVSRLRAHGKRWSELIPHDTELLRVIQRASEQNRAYSHNEVSVPTAGNGDLIIDCRVNLMHNGLQILVELSDAESRMRSNRDTALLTQQSVSRNIGHQLAHEIRNPLAGMRGAAQLLHRQLNEPLTDYTNVIIEETDRLSALVDGMLGPNQPSQRQPVNIHRLLHHVYTLLRADAAQNVTIMEDYDPSLPQLPLDADQIIQVLLNLGRNSMQAMEDSGTLILRTRVESGYAVRGKRYAMVARIDFEDNGPGVPPEIRDTLFYPLITGRATGTGLGLALAQELINRHDGLVQLRSAQSPTLFSIYLPISS